MAFLPHFTFLSHTHDPHPFTAFPSSSPTPIRKFPNFVSSFSQFCSFNHFTVSPFSSSVAKSIPPVEIQQTSDSDLPSSTPGWSEFASKVSGEWDGFGADFTSKGQPLELPEYVVPEAYREWEVKVFDWQTQCPTLAQQEDFLLSYRSVKLLPTVGCEADAATVHSSDVRSVGGEENKALAAAYHRNGSYVSVWPLGETDERKLLEVEHCLMDPSNHESRVRVIQIIRFEGSSVKLEKIKVFSELWYGPFRNGEQLGGCAIRESGFASTEPLKASEVTGVWESCETVASFRDVDDGVFRELVDGSSQEIARDEDSLITLPRRLWCRVKERENGESFAEVGLLLDLGSAISSRCIFSNDGHLKEIAMGRDTAITGVI